jgi:hypothetical protein
MATDLDGEGDAPTWVEAAANLDPLALPDPPPPPERRDARRALIFAVLGVLCFGFVFGPLALARGRRVRLALVGEPTRAAAANTAERAITLGKVGTALHLTLALTVLPWLLFMLPFLRGAGR